MTRQDWWTLLKETGSGWIADKVPRLAAALAFYTILSAAPLLVVALSIAGIAFGRDRRRGPVGGTNARDGR